MLPSHRNSRQMWDAFDFQFTFINYVGTTEINWATPLPQLKVKGKYVESDDQLGDINQDGSFNVLDIVILVNCILHENCDNNSQVDNPALADMNEDGNYNVLDVVILANCVIAENCGDLG